MSGRRNVVPAAAGPTVLLLAVLLLTGCAGTSPEDATASTASGASSSAASTPDGRAVQRSPTATQPPSGTQLTVEVAGGEATGDTGRVPVALGERVTLTVTGDAADELHLHGYDLTAELLPGQPAALTFTADIAGVFEAELHEAGTVLLSLQVG